MLINIVLEKVYDYGVCSLIVPRPKLAFQRSAYSKNRHSRQRKQKKNLQFMALYILNLSQANLASEVIYGSKRDLLNNFFPNSSTHSHENCSEITWFMLNFQFYAVSIIRRNSTLSRQHFFVPVSTRDINFYTIMRAL